MQTARSDTDTQSRIFELGPWFQNMRLGGIETAPEHFLGDYPRFKWEGFKHAVPEDLGGMSVLDIGCNAGFYAFEMKRRGADRVLGIDSDPRYLAQACFASEQLGLEVEFREGSVYDVGALRERFDLVIFMGVFYHLRHPLLALDLIREHVADDLMLFQSMQRGADAVPQLDENYPFSDWDVFEEPGYPRLSFVAERYADDPTNWFIPNRAAVEAMLASSGFEILAHPEREVYMCRIADRHYAAAPPPAIATTR